MKTLGLTVLVALIGLGCQNSAMDKEINQLSNNDTTKVIYGEDGRRDIASVADSPYNILAESTVALVTKSDLTASEDAQTYNLPKKIYGESMGLCEDEAFFSQPAPAWCSGFLVAPNLLVTAGHCISSQSRCEGVSFVFGFHNKATAEETLNIPAENVYHCKTLKGREEIGTGPDWAIVELDRPVMGREPLKVRTEGEVATETGLVVIGHPSGLPTKITEGGKVREVKSDRGYLVGNLDTYGGNSGSAVFNSETLEVEGILVRGERDFVRSENGCIASNHCEDEGCRGEDVTLITEVCDINGVECGTDTPDPTGPNSCEYANDGVCDDGREGAPFAVCAPGTDENDCSTL